MQSFVTLSSRSRSILLNTARAVSESGGGSDEKMSALHSSPVLRGGFDRFCGAARKVRLCAGGGRPHLHLPEMREVSMKVIVLDRPRFLSFFLRKIYGIKKVKEKQQ